MINDEQFNKDKNRLDNEMVNIKKQLESGCERGRQWIDKVDVSLSFVSLARKIFNSTTDLRKKREILCSLGIDFTLKDQQLLIDYVPWLNPVQTLIEKSKTKEFRFELHNFVLNKKKNEAKCLALPSGGG